MNFLVIIVCSTLPLSMVKKRSVLGSLTRVNETVKCFSQNSLEPDDSGSGQLLRALTISEVFKDVIPRKWEDISE